MPDMFTKEKRSEIMSKIRGKDTKIELLLRKALRASEIKGYRLRMNLPGKPDIVFPKYKVVVFCDGDFWHGYKFDEWKDRLAPYWFQKIKGNMERDKENDLKLLKDNWAVIHFARAWAWVWGYNFTPTNHKNRTQYASACFDSVKSPNMTETSGRVALAPTGISLWHRKKAAQE